MLKRRGTKAYFVFSITSFGLLPNGRFMTISSASRFYLWLLSYYSQRCLAILACDIAFVGAFVLLFFALPLCPASGHN